MLSCLERGDTVGFICMVGGGKKGYVVRGESFFFLFSLASFSSRLPAVIFFSRPVTT